jgi:hypothetical protein
MKDPFEEVEHKESAGKCMAGVLEDFLPALKEIAELGSMSVEPYGKYPRSSWMSCPKIIYKDAFWRHILDGPAAIDPESGKPHDVAIAWNALALVCKRLEEEQMEDKEKKPSRMKNFRCSCIADSVGNIGGLSNDCPVHGRG